MSLYLGVKTEISNYSAYSISYQMYLYLAIYLFAYPPHKYFTGLGLVHIQNNDPLFINGTINRTNAENKEQNNKNELTLTLFINQNESVRMIVLTFNTFPVIELSILSSLVLSVPFGNMYCPNEDYTTRILSL